MCVWPAIYFTMLIIDVGWSMKLQLSKDWFNLFAISIIQFKPFLFLTFTVANQMMDAWLLLYFTLYSHSQCYQHLPLKIDRYIWPNLIKSISLLIWLFTRSTHIDFPLKRIHIDNYDYNNQFNFPFNIHSLSMVIYFWVNCQLWVHFCIWFISLLHFDSAK